MPDTGADLRRSSAGQDCTYSLLAKAFHEGFPSQTLNPGPCKIKWLFAQQPLDGKLVSSDTLCMGGYTASDETVGSLRERIDVLNA